MPDPTDAQIDAASAAFWETWTAHMVQMGVPTRVTQLYNLPNIAPVTRACMRAALLAAKTKP
jgi:hypothetical protein